MWCVFLLPVIIPQIGSVTSDLPKSHVVSTSGTAWDSSEPCLTHARGSSQPPFLPAFPGDSFPPSCGSLVGLRGQAVSLRKGWFSSRSPELHWPIMAGFTVLRVCVYVKA